MTADAAHVAAGGEVCGNAVTAYLRCLRAPHHSGACESWPTTSLVTTEAGEES